EARSLARGPLRAARLPGKGPGRAPAARGRRRRRRAGLRPLRVVGARLERAGDRVLRTAGRDRDARLAHRARHRRRAGEPRRSRETGDETRVIRRRAVVARFTPVNETRSPRTADPPPPLYASPFSIPDSPFSPLPMPLDLPRL